METKTCKDCNKELPIEMFHIMDSKRGYRKSYCKDCDYTRKKGWIQENFLEWQYALKRYARENPEKYRGNHDSKKHPAQSGVYIIECVLTGDKYIGCTSNLRNRRYHHFRGVGRSKNKQLSKLIKEYGKEAFSFDVLELCDKEVIFERETHYIQELKPNLNNYKTNK